MYNITRGTIIPGSRVRALEQMGFLKGLRKPKIQPPQSDQSFEICKRAQVKHIINGSGTCHRKPTPTITRLGWAARNQTMIYCSLQISKGNAIHCEFQRRCLKMAV